MIESRYKIEYILPEDEIKKSSPFKVLWYLLLIPLVLLAVVAITYDFSFQNISRDTAILAEKTKVHIFNLGDQKQFKKPDNQTNKIVDKILIPKQKPLVKIEEKVIVKKILVKDEKDKKTIMELTEKQQEQQKKMQEQISQNKKLSQSLTSLSTELIKQKTRNDSLNSKLSEQEKDRIELEEQLNKILAESENNEVLIEDLVEDEIKDIVIESQSNVTNIVKAIEETKTDSDKELVVVSKKTEVIKKPQEEELVKTAGTLKPNTNKVIPENQNNLPEAKIDREQIAIKMADKDDITTFLKIHKIEPVTSNEPKPSTEESIAKDESISETDKIIEAMNSIQSNATTESEKDKVEAPIPNENEKSDSNDIAQETNSQPQSDEIIFAIGLDQEEDDDDKKTEATVVSEERVIETNKISNEEINNDESEVAKKEKTEPEIKTVALEIETEKPKPSSAVDAIIAAMQDSQANNPSFNDNNENIDLELEKEIKQQLVEQGDLSIDN